MLRSFRYRLSPTKAQERMLLAWFEPLRELYNAALEQRRIVWEWHRESLTEYQQFRELPDLRQVRPDLAAIPTVVLRGVISRVDKAFANFVRRRRLGEPNAGYPRFKSVARFRSILIDDLHYLTAGKPLIVAGGKRLVLPRIGKVKFKAHRALRGIPKGLRLVLVNGRWSVSFVCADVPPGPLSRTNREVGVDLGLIHFAATSDGEIFENPRVLTAARIKLERCARRFTRRKPGSNRRRKAARLRAKQYARVANVRRENHIRVSRTLVANYDTIFVEDLTINRMARSRLAKSVRDAAWGLFLKWLHTKAEEAGREVIKVDPRGTSQKCSRCGAHVKKTLKDRIHNCPSCGLILNRDVNAARCVLAAGRAARGAASVVEEQR